MQVAVDFCMGQCVERSAGAQILKTYYYKDWVYGFLPYISISTHLKERERESSVLMPLQVEWVPSRQPQIVSFPKTERFPFFRPLRI
jgi:hypothetical protein